MRSDEEECEEEDGDAEAPEECLLSSAEATVTASANRRPGSPADPLRDLFTHGRSRSTTGCTAARARSTWAARRSSSPATGVLRLTKDLTEAQMAKVMAAKGFTVRLRVPAAPELLPGLLRPPAERQAGDPHGLAWQQAD